MNYEQKIRTKMLEMCNPSYLEVLDESHGHSVPAGAQSHFKLTVVSQKFAELGRVQRHQMIYKALAEELQNGVHALALHLYTEQEWAARGACAPASPACAGRK